MLTNVSFDLEHLSEHSLARLKSALETNFWTCQFALLESHVPTYRRLTRLNSSIEEHLNEDSGDA